MVSSPDPTSDFLAIESTSDLTRPLPVVRQVFNHGMTVLAFLLTGLALLPLFSLVIEILKQGLPNLKWEVFTSLPAPQGLEGVPNGFGNAILGTLIMVGLAALVSIPIGILTAIYLAEFGRGRVPEIVRFIVTVLTGVPSIVVGVFAYAVIVFSTKRFSGLAGSFALAVVMLPIIVLSTEEALKLVPKTQRLASAALGGSRFQTVFRVVFLSALPGITTGLLLAIARAAGETAPLIFTALFSQNWPTGLLDPMASLSVMIYNYAQSPFVEQNQMAWTASLVLLSLVLVTNVLSRLATRKRN